MEPPAPRSTADNSGTNAAGPSTTPFQSASSYLKTNSTRSSSWSNSLRNASGGQPPLPPKENTNGTSSPNGHNGDSEGRSQNVNGAPVKQKPINRPAASKNAIVYNAVQRRNPVLQSIKNVGIEIGDIPADYQVGTHSGVLFLSLKYHRLHPEYIHQRIEKMKNMYNVRILLILCDINEHQQSLRELTKIAIINQLTTFVAWSNDEVAQYLSTFKAYEHKTDDTLKEKVHQEYHDQLQHVLTSGKKVNKTDADNLASQFGSFANIAKQPSKLLSNVKGLGATKVTSLLDAFNKPFLVGGLKRPGSESSNEVGVPTIPRVDGSGDEDLDPINSPDWPEEDLPAGPAEVVGGGRDRVPSRSPGLSPPMRPTEDDGQNGVGGDGEAWRDPFDDAEDENDAGHGDGPDPEEDEEEDVARSAKKARLG